MQVCARKELQRLKKDINELSIKLVGDSRINHLNERGNDTIQARSDLDFGVKFPTIQFYVIAHNSKYNHWIELKLYQKTPEVFVYVKINFQLNRNSAKTCNIGQNRLYKFYYLLLFTCGLSIWQSSFFYKDMTACFWNLLVLQGSLIGCNIAFKCGKDSLMFQNLFLITIPYSSFLHKKRKAGGVY